MARAVRAARERVVRRICRRWRGCAERARRSARWTRPSARLVVHSSSTSQSCGRWTRSRRSEMSNLHVRPADHCDLQIAADVGVSMHEDMHEVRVRAIAQVWRAVRRERRSAIEWRTADHAILEGVEQKMRLAQRARASEA